MNKDLLVKKIAENIEGATQKDVRVIVDEFVETIITAVAAGETVKISGFGNFEAVERAARIARNPRTGETVEVAASKVPKFKAAKNFKDIVKA